VLRAFDRLAGASGCASFLAPSILTSLSTALVAIAGFSLATCLLRFSFFGLTRFAGAPVNERDEVRRETGLRILALTH